VTAARGADAVVVGGGCTGAAIACHLAQRGLDVLLLERHGLASGPTGRSTAIVRQFYSHPLLVEMAVHGLRSYSSFRDAYGGSCGFVRTGVLWSVEERDRAVLERNVALGTSLGASLYLLEPDELATIDPRISVEGLAALCYEPEGGHCDPYLATAGFAAAARRAGARVEEGVAVLAVTDGAVETDAGRVEADAVVVAAGPWAPALLEPLGYELPVRVARAEVGRFRLPASFEPAPPALADFSRLLFYFKAAEPGYLEVGSLDPTHVERPVDPDAVPEGGERETLAAYFDALVQRVPELRGGHWRGAWSGTYDVTPDWHPAIGAVPGCERVFVAAGFSGHGFKLAPAVGIAVAELVADGASATFDLGLLDPTRFARSELLSSQYGVIA
jgi:glycine/D-amino acid oxidase-like deaminating enzyme